MRAQLKISLVGFWAVVALLLSFPACSTAVPTRPISRPVPTATPVPTPLPPIFFGGTSDMTTDSFYILRKCQINWIYQPANDKASFGFFVYPEGETEKYIESVEPPAPASGSVPIHWGGRYYVKVQASNVTRWIVEIQAVWDFPEKWIPVFLDGTYSQVSKPFYVVPWRWSIRWTYIPQTEAAGLSLYVYDADIQGPSIASVHLSPERIGNINMPESDPFKAKRYYVRVVAKDVKRWTLDIIPGERPTGGPWGTQR